MLVVMAMEVGGPLMQRDVGVVVDGIVEGYVDGYYMNLDLVGRSGITAKRMQGKMS